MESLKALESQFPGSLRDVGESLDDFTDSVDASLQVDGGSKETALGVLLSLGDLVVALVGLEESDDSSGALLCLFLSAGEADGALVANACLRSVVEVGQVKGIMRELLSIELHQVAVPFLSELPNDCAGDLHFA